MKANQSEFGTSSGTTDSGTVTESRDSAGAAPADVAVSGTGAFRKSVPPKRKRGSAKVTGSGARTADEFDPIATMRKIAAGKRIRIAGKSEKGTPLWHRPTPAEVFKAIEFLAAWEARRAERAPPPDPRRDIAQISTAELARRVALLLSEGVREIDPDPGTLTMRMLDARKHQTGQQHIDMLLGILRGDAPGVPYPVDWKPYTPTPPSAAAAVAATHPEPAAYEPAPFDPPPRESRPSSRFTFVTKGNA